MSNLNTETMALINKQIANSDEQIWAEFCFFDCYFGIWIDVEDIIDNGNWESWLIEIGVNDDLAYEICNRDILIRDFRGDIAKICTGNYGFFDFSKFEKITEITKEFDEEKKEAFFILYHDDELAALENFEASYQGKFSNDADYAYHFLENRGVTELIENDPYIRAGFNYQDYFDSMLDCAGHWSKNGFYFMPI